MLEISQLSIAFHGQPVVRDVSFSVAPGEIVALVGESGSGKSVIAQSILKLLPAEYPSGAIRFNGQDVLQLQGRALSALRGRQIAMVFQEPMTALNPLLTVGEQISEALRLHEGLAPKAAMTRALDWLARVGLPDPRRCYAAYPHALSGGQRQRAMIAMAMACNPALLIADEPTTALDVTLQAQIVDLMLQLQRETGMALLFITHDLLLVRRLAQRVIVLEKGRLVESGTIDQIFTAPQEAYTRELLASYRLSDTPVAVAAEAPTVLTARQLAVRYPLKKTFWGRVTAEHRAVCGLDLQLRAGETLGLVGESGSGKTSAALAMLKLIPFSGELEIAGRAVHDLRERALRPWRRHWQVVFQDPFSSLSPRLTIEQIVAEGLSVHEPQLPASERRSRVLAALRDVGLDESALPRYPQEFSGGQRQRIAIARALVLRPKLLILDEPTSALDATVQRQVLELLRRLQLEQGLAYVLITHDWRVVRALAHRVLVLKDGEVIEQAATADLLAKPQQAYTRKLLAAAMLDAAV